MSTFHLRSGGTLTHWVGQPPFGGFPTASTLASGGYRAGADGGNRTHVDLLTEKGPSL